MTEDSKQTNKAPENNSQHLEEQMQKWQAKATDLEKRLAKFDGVDVDEYKALKTEVSDLRKESAKDPGKLEEVLAKEKADLEKRFGKKFEEYESKNKDLSSKLMRLEVVNPAIQKAASLFNDKELPLIQMLVERDLTISNGEIVVKGEDGKPKPSKKDPRHNMDLDEYLEALAEQYPGCAKPRQKGGAIDSGTRAPANGEGGMSISLSKYLSMDRAAALEIPLEERGKLAEQALRTANFKLQ